MSSPPRIVQPGEPIIVNGGSGRSPRPSITPAPPSQPSSSSTTARDQQPGGSGDRVVSRQQEEVDADEAVRLARLCRAALNLLAEHAPDFNPSRPCLPDEVLRMPLHAVRLDESLLALPRRKSRRMPLAAAIGNLMFPSHDRSLSPLIRYDADRVRIRAWVTLQRNYDLMTAATTTTTSSSSAGSGATKRMGMMGHSRLGANAGAAPGVHVEAWAARIRKLGPWYPDATPVSLAGPRCPPPVEGPAAEAAVLEPFFTHIANRGTSQRTANCPGECLNGGEGEGLYKVAGLEFKRGIIYEDRRVDLHKANMGPAGAAKLMASLRTNTFAKHLLLGNNNIGPDGAKAVSKFATEFPNRIETWYLAGNCIDAASLKCLVDAFKKSQTMTGIWLKGNPLGPGAVEHIFQLMTQTGNLRTLDLDQTELGDEGVRRLFTRLADYVKEKNQTLPVEVLYLSGNGISTAGAAAIARFLAAQSKITTTTIPTSGKSAAAASSTATLHTLHLSLNPLGNEGVSVLAKQGLVHAPRLRRLFLQSVGLSSAGAATLCAVLRGNNKFLQVLDLGQAYRAPELGLLRLFNHIDIDDNDHDDDDDDDDKDVTKALSSLLLPPQRLEYLNLGHTALRPASLRVLADAARRSSSLLFYQALSIHATDGSDSDSDDDDESSSDSDDSEDGGGEGTTTAATTSASASASAAATMGTKGLRPLVPSQGNVFEDPTTGAALTRELSDVDKAVARRLAANVRARYGDGCTYQRFRDEEKRWLVCDRADIRKVDSVYRARDDVDVARQRVLAMVNV